MQLRHKFTLVAFVYLLSLVVTLVLSAWCILVYFDSAFGDFETDLARQDLVDQIRATLRQQGKDLADNSSPEEKAQAFNESQQQIEAGLSRLAQDTELDHDLRSGLELALLHKNAAATRYLASPAADTREGAV